MSLPLPSPTVEELSLSDPEHEQTHMFDDGTARVPGRVCAQRRDTRRELRVRQSREKGIRAQCQLVREVLPTCREWVLDNLVGLKTEAGTLKQGEHFVAGWQLGFDDCLEPAEELRLRIDAIARGIAHDQPSL